MKKVMISVMIILNTIYFTNINVFAKTFQYDLTFESKPQRFVDITIDGKLLEYVDVKGFVNQKGRTMVPIRFISEKMGFKVDWFPETQEVKVTNKKTATVKLGIKEYYASKTIRMVKGDDWKANAVQFDVFPEIIDDRTFVPIRLIAEMFGYKVEWNAELGRVDIFTIEKYDGYEVELDSLLKVYFKKEDNVNNIDVGIMFNFFRDPDIQKAEFKKLIESKYGDTKEVKEVIDYINNYDVNTNYEAKFLNINGENKTMVRMGGNTVDVVIYK